MPRLKSFLTVLGAVIVLALAANTVAYAATGDQFLLGKTNKANAQSTLERTTTGPALRLSTKSSSSAPLTTNARGKVGNLNADLLDGKDATAFAPAPTVIRGDWSISGTAAGPGELASDSISYGWTLPSAPTPHLVVPNTPMPTGCSGSAAAPSAAPGNLCVFVAFTDGNFNPFNICDAANDTCPSADRWGATVAGSAADAGNFGMSGTWAVATTSSVSASRSAP